MSNHCRLWPTGLLIVLLGVATAMGQRTPYRVVTGANAGDKLGESLASVPDITGDGRPELLVGVFRADAPASPTTLIDAGAAILYNGANLKKMNTFYGQKALGRMGYAAAMSWVLFGFIFAVTLLQTRLQRRWVHYDR